VSKIPAVASAQRLKAVWQKEIPFCMKIALIGATGGTGRAFIDQAVAGGHSVTALARNPSKLQAVAHKIQVVQADAREPESLRKALSGPLDAVVCIVGASGLLEARRVTDLYSTTAKNLEWAMNEVGLTRLLLVSSSGVEPQENDNWFYVNVLKRFFLQPMYDDMLRMESQVRASKLDYTIVRPPYLTSGSVTGKYRVSTSGNFKDDKTLTREDLAHFLLLAVSESAKFSRMTVALSE
jgi:putative NADH-flavin reductase